MRIAFCYLVAYYKAGPRYGESFSTGLLEPVHMQLDRNYVSSFLISAFRASWGV